MKFLSILPVALLATAAAATPTATDKVGHTSIKNVNDGQPAIPPQVASAVNTIAKYYQSQYTTFNKTNPSPYAGPWMVNLALHHNFSAIDIKLEREPHHFHHGWGHGGENPMARNAHQQ